MLWIAMSALSHAIAEYAIWLAVEVSQAMPARSMHRASFLFLYHNRVSILKGDRGIVCVCHLYQLKHVVLEEGLPTFDTESVARPFTFRIRWLRREGDGFSLSLSGGCLSVEDVGGIERSLLLSPFRVARISLTTHEGGGRLAIIGRMSRAQCRGCPVFGTEEFWIASLRMRRIATQALKRQAGANAAARATRTLSPI